MRSRWRKSLIPGIVALLALGVWAELQDSRPSQETTSEAALSEDEQTRPAATSQLSPSAMAELHTPSPGSPASISRNFTRAATPAPTPFAAPDEAALGEIDKVGLMLRDYRTIAGENPVGTNAEIMGAVMGGNEKHATLGPPEGMKLNDKGELIDRWGTPYFFHQLSRDHMEIRSAGPDRVMWTDDDPIIR